jgi:hypothetical protein
MAGVKGNKGGGRKSAYQEKHDADLLSDIWHKPMVREEIKQRLAQGKYSLRDMFISKAYAGNERILSEIFKKLYPDKLEHSGDIVHVTLTPPTKHAKA